jgi:hypothetical protein
MKLNDKQIDDIARCLGNIGVAAAIGLAVGVAGYAAKPLTDYDKLGLAAVLIVSFVTMILIRKGK